jgi:hypothetical protein
MDGEEKNQDKKAVSNKWNPFCGYHRDDDIKTKRENIENKDNEGEGTASLEVSSDDGVVSQYQEEELQFQFDDMENFTKHTQKVIIGETERLDKNFYIDYNDDQDVQ